jgi:hypothetical protein
MAAVVNAAAITARRKRMSELFIVVALRAKVGKEDERRSDGWIPVALAQRGGDVRYGLFEVQASPTASSSLRSEHF